MSSAVMLEVTVVLALFPVLLFVSACEPQPDVIRHIASITAATHDLFTFFKLIIFIHPFSGSFV